jgi:Ser/Thr protein kinase RdoA (MazF antagonist)
LRRFHELPPLPHTASCNTHRRDIIAAIERFTDCLGKQTPDRHFFKELRQKLVHAAGDLLPDALPLGLMHRDFTPANVLVDSEGRVTTLDTQGRWRGPVYADLAQFLIALKVSWQQICTAGWYCDARTLAACEHDFFRGYFEETPVPTGAIRLFECLLILDWWVALAHYRHTARGVRRPIRWVQLHFCSRYLKRYVRAILAQMDDHVAASRRPSQAPATEMQRWQEAV